MEVALNPPNAAVSATTKSSGRRRAATMEESKKRKFEEDSINGGVSDLDSASQIRFLLDPLRKDQLVDLLVKLGNQYPSVAEDIRGLASLDPIHRKLFVRGLSWDTTSETLCAVFSVHGEIEEGAVIVDKATGKSRGYGFITYKHMASTIRALQEPSKLIDGRLSICNLACDGLNSTSGTGDLALRKIYIGGISPNISSEILLNFFGRYGEIEEGSVAYDKETNKSRGFGFVTYKTAEGAKKAIDDPNKTLGGRNITVKLADAPRSKLIQAQVPTAVVPMPIPVPIGNAPTGKALVGGYASYPPTMAAYLTAYASTQFTTAAQVSHPQTGKREQVVPAVESNGVTGYPYYVTGP